MKLRTSSGGSWRKVLYDGMREMIVSFSYFILSYEYDRIGKSMSNFENIFTNKRESKESIFQKASLLRSRIKSRIELGDFPSSDFIFDCREIIALFRDIPHENADRSARFSKSTKERLIKKIGGCSSCGGGVSGGNRQSAILEIHHIIPREHGGDESVENGISFCRNCHGEVHR